MSLKPIIYIGFAAVAIMFGMKYIRGSEILVTEDGIVSATTLPLDQTTAEIKYETATFGLG